MSFASDDSSPTGSLPSSPSTSATSLTDDLNGYRAPLNGEAPEPSIDGTSVGGGEGGIRAESVDEITDDDKKVRVFVKSLARLLAFLRCSGCS